MAGDWTFVTRNSRDFRGKRGLHGKQAVHAGLVCLNAAEGMDLDLQLQLFEFALDELAEPADLVNQVLEITLLESGEIEIARYGLPVA